MIQQFYEITTDRMDDTAELMFNGESESTDFLYSLISEGKMTPGCEPGEKVCGDTRGTVGATELRRAWETAMYGYLIPQMWKLEDVNPVVIVTEGLCKDVGVGTGYNGYVRSQDAEWARGCLDTGTLLYLLAPTGSAVDQGSFGVYVNRPFSTPPGLESIKNGAWVGVKIEDMILRYVSLNFRHLPLLTLSCVSAAEWTLLKNGNRKGAIDDPAYKAKENYNLMWNVIGNAGSVVRTPGLVDIPACTEGSARRNWLLKANQRWYSWPCDK